MGVIHIDETSFKQNHSRTRLWYIKLSILVHEYTLKFLFVPQIVLQQIALNIVKKDFRKDFENDFKWWPDYWHAENWHAENWHGGQLTCGQLACGKLAWRTIGMRTIGMEDNWHGGQLALTFSIVSYLITLIF